MTDLQTSPAQWSRPEDLCPESTPEHDRTWNLLGRIFGEPLCENHDSHEVWQYLGTRDGIHQFRHRDLPPRSMIEMREKCRRVGARTDEYGQSREYFSYGDTKQHVLVVHQQNGRTYCNMPAR